MKFFFNKPKTSHENRIRDLSRPPCKDFIIRLFILFSPFLYILYSFRIISIQKHYIDNLTQNFYKENLILFRIINQFSEKKMNFNSHISRQTYRNIYRVNSNFHLQLAIWLQFLEYLLGNRFSTGMHRVLRETFLHFERSDRWERKKAAVIGANRRSKFYWRSLISKAVLKRLEKHTFGRIADYKSSALCYAILKIRREMIGDTPASGPKRKARDSARKARDEEGFGIPERIEYLVKV